MITLPVYNLLTLPCPTLDGYATNQEPIKKYWGGEYTVQKPKINVTLFANSEKKLLALADFYYNVINSGNIQFMITLPFEGITDHEWTVKLVGKFDTSYVFTNVGKKSITLEIQDDVPTVVRDELIRQNILGA